MSAVVIGLCALVVSIYEARLVRAEQRAAVMPLLELGRSWNVADSGDGGSRLLLHAENVGIGPARIHDFRVTVDGSPQPTWDAAMRTLIRRSEPVSYGQSTINGRTVPPGRSIVMFDLDDASLIAPLLDEFGRLDFTACYCSIFDECWTTSYRGFGTVSMAAGCSADDTSFTE